MAKAHEVFRDLVYLIDCTAPINTIVFPCVHHTIKDDYFCTVWYIEVSVVQMTVPQLDIIAPRFRVRWILAWWLGLGFYEGEKPMGNSWRCNKKIYMASRSLQNYCTALRRWCLSNIVRSASSTDDALVG